MMVKEIVEDDDNLYIVSEYLKGGDLFDRKQRVGKFSESDAAYII